MKKSDRDKRDLPLGTSTVIGIMASAMHQIIGALLGNRKTKQMNITDVD